MEIPSQLQELAPKWSVHLKRIVDLTKLKPQPNPDLDMNKFTRCIVGEVRGGNIYFMPHKFPKTYCETCVTSSRRISEEYHKMKDREKSKFTPVVSEFIKHFKETHNNK